MNAHVKTVLLVAAASIVVRLAIANVPSVAPYF